jgi:hypothetical protein
MVDSPLDSLYYVIKSVFSPALRHEGSSTKSVSNANNQQIQSSLVELEQVLRAAAKKSGSTSTSIGNVFHPRDELTYWQEMANGKDADRAKYFLELFDPVKEDFKKFER